MASASAITFQNLSGTESLGRARFRSCGFDVAILCRRGGLQRRQEAIRDVRDLIDSLQKCRFVNLGRFVDAADFSHVLDGCCANLVGRGWRVEVEELFDVAAHYVTPPANLGSDYS